MFGDDHFKLLLPSYLTEPNKYRLRDALKQFLPEYRENQIDYTDFYKKYENKYFMQSDLMAEIRLRVWDINTQSYNKNYIDAIIVSNTCDVSFENKRDVNPKQCLLAPIINLHEYVDDLGKCGYGAEKIKAFEENVKSQLLANIFYLPPHLDMPASIALLDRIFWFPAKELNAYIDTIDQDRMLSLSQFGFYLFILKLSYHLCRLPEQCDREVA
jgi:hypothetical protein